MRFDDAQFIYMRAPNTHCLVRSQAVLMSAYKTHSTCALMTWWSTAPDGICQGKKETVHSKQARNIIQSIYLYENATDSIFKCDSTKSPSNLLIPSCAFPVRVSFSWPQCVLSISISTCQSVAHLFSAIASPALSQQSVADFHHRLLFFSLSPASAYKPETLPPALPRCWKWRESGKGVITMSIHKHCTPRDCMDESANATGKLPTQPGQVICYTVEQNDKHSDSGVHTKRKVQTVGR